MRFLYLAATGPGDATRASLPFHLAANGALEEGHDVTLALVGDGVELVIGDNPQTVEGLGLPPLRELLEKLKGRAAVYV
ncbi:MAG: DsrE family protein [Actinomycetota bacterium]